VRHLDPTTGAATIATDARSDKAAHLRSNPCAELSFWLPGLRVQYRLRGAIDVNEADEAARRDLWASLSDAARALFAWPSPGQPRIDAPDAYPGGLPASAPIPDAFLPLILRPDRVERLDLRPHPHQRTRWRLATGWVPEELNP
jgi:pyridoxamine 5'-phosphate oxidase